jgi:hypothetical protein
MPAFVPVDLARATGHVADHVNHLGLGGFKDWKLMAFVLKHDYTFYLRADRAKRDSTRNHL